MPAERHSHEPGEDRTQCPNCILEKMENEMSELERAMLSWFLLFGNQFCRDAGITHAEWLRLQFDTETDRAIAVEILKTLDLAVRSIGMERTRERNG